MAAFLRMNKMFCDRRFRLEFRKSKRWTNGMQIVQRNKKVSFLKKKKNDLESFERMMKLNPKTYLQGITPNKSFNLCITKNL